MDALVTGGGGFLGRAIVRCLLARGARVRSLSRGSHRDLATWGVDHHSADLADAAAVERAVSGCDVVFHVAAKAGVWGPYAEYFAANVMGTRNVLAACRQQRVPRLVFTSSPSVTFGGQDQCGLTEATALYPARYLASYPQTKAISEREVLAANSPSLATVALRPHLIWGPGDQHLIPRLIARARAGRLRKFLGPPAMVDAVYIDNAAEAHVLAADALTPGAALAGKAYFITNDEPVVLWNFIDQILACANLPPLRRTISARSAYAVGMALEGLWTLLRRRDEPVMTRFVARQLATSHWFDITAAKQDFGYRPRIGMAEGLARLGESLRPHE